MQYVFLYLKCIRWWCCVAERKSAMLTTEPRLWLRQCIHSTRHVNGARHSAYSCMVVAFINSALHCFVRIIGQFLNVIWYSFLCDCVCYVVSLVWFIFHFHKRPTLFNSTPNSALYCFNVMLHIVWHLVGRPPLPLPLNPPWYIKPTSLQSLR